MCTLKLTSLLTSLLSLYKIDIWASKRDKIMNTHTHTQLNPKLVNTMKAHKCNIKRSQKTFELRANKPNLSHTSRNVTHYEKSNFLRGGSTN